MIWIHLIPAFQGGDGGLLGNLLGGIFGVLRGVTGLAANLVGQLLNLSEFFFLISNLKKDRLQLTRNVEVKMINQNQVRLL